MPLRVHADHYGASRMMPRALLREYTGSPSPDLHYGSSRMTWSGVGHGADHYGSSRMMPRHGQPPYGTKCSLWFIQDDAWYVHWLRVPEEVRADSDSRRGKLIPKLKPSKLLLGLPTLIDLFTGLIELQCSLRQQHVLFLLWLKPKRSQLWHDIEPGS